MTATYPLLLDGDDLPLQELRALCLDGQLFRVGDLFVSADTPDTPELRARAFVAAAPVWAVADRGTAAWIHGTRGAAPALPQVCVESRRRGGRQTVSLDACYRSIGSGEIVEVGPARVTTALQTAIDLLSAPADFGAGAALEIRHLLQLADAEVNDLDTRLRTGRRRGCTLARSRLPAVEAAELPSVSLR
jgi:hypothetical protein